MTRPMQKILVRLMERRSPSLLSLTPWRPALRYCRRLTKIFYRGTEGYQFSGRAFWSMRMGLLFCLKKRRPRRVAKTLSELRELKNKFPLCNLSLFLSARIKRAFTSLLMFRYKMKLPSIKSRLSALRNSRSKFKLKRGDKPSGL